MLWKIQKFDWLIPETKWHSCLHNRALCSDSRFHSSQVEPAKIIQINKNIPLFEWAIACSNNSMLWRTVSLLTAVIKITTRATYVCTSAMTSCKQYSAKFEDFQNIKFTELSQSAFIFDEYLYIILTFLGHYSMLNAVLRPQNVCKPTVDNP